MNEKSKTARSIDVRERHAVARTFSDARGPRVCRLSALVVVLALVSSAPAPAQGTALTKQTGLTITNGAAVQPSACSNAGVCAGTPTWNNSTNKNQILGCAITVETANIRWTAASGDTPTTAAGTLWQPGNYYLAGRANVQNFKAIATTATNAALTFECFRS